MAGKVYTRAELAQLWTSNGGSPATAPMAVAVALAESGGRADATHVNSDGSIDRGPWQINSVHGALSTLDPNANAKAAVKISSGGLNWQPWTTYTSGAFRKYLQPGASVPRPSSTAQTPAASDLFADHSTGLKYASLWLTAVAAGLAIAVLGVNQALGGAPARAARTGAKKAAAAAVVA
jgi:hypothetical protein